MLIREGSLTKEQIEKIFGKIKGETVCTQAKHDFFLELLNRWIDPKIEFEKVNVPIIEKKDFFCLYLYIKYVFEWFLKINILFL